MNIVFCTDENFVIPCLVSITSVLENNKDEDCCIFVLTNGISEKSVSKFGLLADKYGQKINIVRVDDSYFEGLVTPPYFPRSIYFRYLIPQILKTEQKALYLDCDIIVRGNLKAFYDRCIEGKPCSVVIDQNSDDVVIKNRVMTSSPYWNSGVLLMNLQYWRENDVTRRLVEYIGKNPDKCIYPDQDAMNILFDGLVDYAGCEYNCQSHWMNDLASSRVSVNHWDEIKKAVSNPVIVHFCEINKPWLPICSHPLKNEYLHYAYLCKFIAFDSF